MRKKIVGIFVCMLLIATAMPAIGTTNIGIDGQNKSSQVINQEVEKDNIHPLHDPDVDFYRLYGGENYEVFRNIKQTSDGGYVTVGVWNTTSHGMVKLDADGDVVWVATALQNKTLWPRCYIVEETSDGGYITAGCHEDINYGIGFNRCIWKVDGDGNTEWLKIYDDPLNGYHMCIQETSDGGFIVSGEEFISLTDWDVFLMKTDADGNVEWQQTYKYGDYGDNAYAVRQTSDGGYILSGRTGVSSSNADFLIIKTDSYGNIEWDKTYGGKYWDQSQSNDILITPDGDYLFLAETSSFGVGRLDIWLIKTDSNGTELWNKTFGGKYQDLCGGMDFTDDGGIIITGTLKNDVLTNPKAEGLVIKTDQDGNLEWQLTFGAEDDDQLQSVCSTSDKGYVVAGNFIDTTGGETLQGCVIKMKAFKNNHPDVPKGSGKTKIDPGKSYIYEASTTDPDGDQVYYMWDWGDGNFSEWLGPYESGEKSETENFWDKGGKYNIKVRAKDEHGAECEWVNPKTKSIPLYRTFNFNQNLLKWLFTRFHNAFPILRQLLGF